MRYTQNLPERSLTLANAQTHKHSPQGYISLKASINCFSVMLTPDPQINRDQNDDEGKERVKAAYSNCFSQSEQLKHDGVRAKKS